MPQPRSGFQLPFHAFCANSNSLIVLHSRKYLPIIEAAAAGNTPEALIMVLAAQSLHILTYNRPSALFALGGLPLGSFGLAAETPGITIFLNVRHALLEWVAAFRA